MAVKLEIYEHERKERLCVSILEYIDNRIDHLQQKNEKKSLGEVETADIRGSISELRALRSLLDPKPVKPVSPIPSPYL